MPVEVKENYIRIRVANPKQFIRFATKTLGKGIRAVIGFKKGGGSQIQSLLFPRKQYTLSQAKAWAKKHDYSVSETFAVYDIDVMKNGEDMFIEKEVTVEESHNIPLSKDYNAIFEKLMKSIDLQ